MSEKTDPENNIGNGVPAAAETDEPGTAAPSPRSTLRVKRRTGIASVVPTFAESLQILQQALVNLQSHGVRVQAIPHTDRHMAILALSGVGYCQSCRNLRPWEDMQGYKCQYCSQNAST